MKDLIDVPEGNPATKRRGTGAKLALLAVGVAVGAVTATALGANAATTNGSGTTGTAASNSTSTSAPAPHGYGDGDGDHGRHGRGPMRGEEKTVAAATAAKLKAAALKAVPGGSVDRVETDSGDATYEAHMTKADGTKVTVKFDKALKVTGVESGMGK